MTLVGLTDDVGSFSASVATTEANITDGAWFRFSQSTGPNWQARIKNSNSAEL